MSLRDGKNDKYEGVYRHEQSMDLFIFCYIDTDGEDRRPAWIPITSKYGSYGSCMSRWGKGTSPSDCGFGDKICSLTDLGDALYKLVNKTDE